MIHPGGKVTEALGGTLLSPAGCFLHGGGALDTEAVFLDLHTYIEDYGSLYLCLDCAREIGRATGQEDMQIFSDLASTNLILVNRVKELEGQLNKLGEVVEHDILRLVLNRHDSNASSVSVFSDEFSEPPASADELYERYLDPDSSDESSATTEQSGQGTESPEPTPIDRPDDAVKPTSRNTKRSKSSLEL